MKIELNKREYEYIYQCFSELMPQYCAKMKDSLFIDDNIYRLGFAKEPVYVIDIEVAKEDRENFFGFYQKLKKHKSKEEYDKLDLYSEFYFFLNDFDKK